MTIILCFRQVFDSLLDMAAKIVGSTLKMGTYSAVPNNRVARNKCVGYYIVRWDTGDEKNTDWHIL